MGFLKNLKKLFESYNLTSSYSNLSNFISFKIKCNRCNEEILVKLRKSSDISRIYEDDKVPANASFFVRKKFLAISVII